MHLDLTPYKFKRANNWLDNQGFPELIGGANITEDDILKAFEKGKLFFDPQTQEIKYLDSFGEICRTIIYKYRFGVNYGGTFQLPKKHILKCKIVRDLMAQNNFDGYVAVTYPAVPVKDNWPPFMTYKNSRLDVCPHCKDEIEPLVHVLRKQYKQAIERNRFSGNAALYNATFDWEYAGRVFREKMNYTCQKCGITSPPISRKFLQTHHRDWNASNHQQSNLQCLCVLCHFNLDSIHQKYWYGHPLLREYVKMHQYAIERNPIGQENLAVWQRMMG